MSGDSNGDGYRGFQSQGSSHQGFNSHTLHVQSILARIATSTLVQVKAVTNSGGVSPVGE